MDMYEFGKVCQPLNKKYNELFGYIRTTMTFLAQEKNMWML